MSLSRRQVYELIDGERDYQDKRWPHDAPSVGSHDVGTYILFIKGYVNQAIHDVTFTTNKDLIRSNFRKIAALAVRCMEGHGAYQRVLPKPPTGRYDALCLVHGDRSEIYKVIDGERDYQNSLPPQRTAGEEHEVGAYLLMLSEYVDKAQAAWTDNAGDLGGLDVLRKVAGIAVRCMEAHGCPPRG